MRPSWLGKAALAFCLFGLNLWIAGRLVGIEWLDQMPSIEGARIAQARWILENWRDLNWFPLWYGGIPFENVYPPLFPALTALLAAASGLTVAHSFHIASALVYALGPVAVFLLARRLTGGCAWGLLAGMFYSVLSPSLWFFPVLVRDVGSVWAPRRLQNLVVYGEAPHLGALAVLPFAFLALILAWDRRKPTPWLIAAACGSAVLVTNWLGAAEWLLFLFAWTVSRSHLFDLEPWKRAALYAAAAYALASPWMPPSTVLAFITSEELTVAGYASQLPARLFFLTLAAAGLAALLWFAERNRWSREFRFVSVLLYESVLLLAPTLWSTPGRYEHLLRFHLFFELSLALFAAFAARFVGTRMRHSWRPYTLSLVLLWSVYPAVRFKGHAGQIIRPVEIEQTVEHQVAAWLAQNLPEARVFVTGSIRFYLNAFADVAQFDGGFDPGVINPNHAKVRYQILQGEGAGEREGEVAALWLKAFGVDAIAVSGPKTRQAYLDYRNPAKFEGVLPELWRDGGDVLYQVPRRRPGIAHVVRREDVPSRAPAHGMDLDPVEPYLRALEDPALPSLSFRWLNRHQAEIDAVMTPAEVISVQITHHPGWRATANGKPCKLLRDALGQIVIEPSCAGNCRVVMTYTGGIERTVTRVAALATLLVWFAWTVACALRQKRSAPS